VVHAQPDVATLNCTRAARRFLFRDFVAEQTAKHEWWQAVEHAIEHEGWKIVLLLRLTPLVPFNLLNYALACTAVRFWDYTWASSVGVLPGMVRRLRRLNIEDAHSLLAPTSDHTSIGRHTIVCDLYVEGCPHNTPAVLSRQAFFIYLGSLAQNLVDLASSKTAPRMDLTTTLITAAVSGLMITAVAFLTGSYAKRAIEQKLAGASRQMVATELQQIGNDNESEHLLPAGADRTGLNARTQVAREEDAV